MDSYAQLATCLLSFPSGVCSGVKKMVVDGEKIEGVVIPHVEGRRLADVKIIMG